MSGPLGAIPYSGSAAAPASWHTALGGSWGQGWRRCRGLGWQVAEHGGLGVLFLFLCAEVCVLTLLGGTSLSRGAQGSVCAQ